MKCKRMFRLFSLSLAVVLCITAFSIPAFAAGNEKEEHTEDVPQKEISESVAAVTNEKAKDTVSQLPYEIKNNEDGTVTISVAGKEWTFDPNDKESTAKIGTVVDVSSYLHLRAGAGMSEAIIGHLLNGDKVDVVGKDGEWYKVVVPEQSGYVHEKYLKVAETAATDENGEVDREMMSMLLYLLLAGGMDNSNSSASLTPDGNLTLIDDIGSVTGQGQQFITFETKSGNTFYMVIDRNDKGDENVHFLNLVDEADLMALMEDDQKAATPPIVCTCKEKCAAGKVDTACPICKNNMSECTGKDQTVESVTEPEQQPQKEKSSGTAILVVLLLLAAGGGATAYFLVLKPKQGKKIPSNLDDFDLEDEEEYLNEDTETEELNE